MLAAPMALVAVAFVALRGGSSAATKQTPTTQQQQTAPRQYSPDQLLRAILADEVDPFGDRDVLRTVLAGMDADARARWMTEIASQVALLSPEQHASLQRRMGFYALSQGYVDAGWTMLAPLMNCTGCPKGARDDAARLLDQYTPDDDLRRHDLNVLVEARAMEVLNGEPSADAPLPLVWSAIARMRREGRFDQATSTQRLYADRFAGVLSPQALRNARQNLANDLLRMGHAAEAQPLLLEVASANQGAVMSETRAEYLVQAARAGGPEGRQEAVTLLEGAIANTAESPSAATALIYLELQTLRLSNHQQVIADAQRFWQARNGFAALPEISAAITEAHAMICFRAAEAAQALGQSVEADTWMHRVLEAGPGSQTAATVRGLLNGR
ncbi:MAG: hypothetical protein QM783_09335 [Phycisphaerales bacterium]